MENKSLIIQDLPDDFERMKIKLELYFKNNKKSGGEAMRIQEHPEDKRKAFLIYATIDDYKNVLDRRIHKLNFQDREREVTVTLPDKTSSTKIKPDVLPKPKLCKQDLHKLALQTSQATFPPHCTQVSSETQPTTASHKENKGDTEISDLLITTQESMDKEMLQMYCEQFAEQIALRKHGTNSWILKLFDQSELQKILDHTEHDFGISVKVYKEGNLGEKLDPRRFILTGFDGNTECPKISLFISSCSRTKEHVWEILDEDRVIVTFRQDIDVTSFIKKCTSRPLQGRDICVTRVELTDSVLVQGDLGPLDEHFLTSYFCNKKRSGGGDIKSLNWINRQNSVIITFQECAAAHKVVEQKHNICDTEVKASLFYSAFQKALTGETSTLTDVTTKINIPVHEELLGFIKKNDQCRKSLENDVKLLHAKMLTDNTEAASAIILEMDVGKKSLTALEIGPTWETKIRRKVQTFLSKYDTAELNVEKDIWKRVRNKCMKLVTHEATVSFSELSSKICIAGLKEEVTVLSGKIKKLLEKTAAEFEIQRNTVDATIQLDCREKCDLIKECVQSKLGEVTLTLDEDQHKLHLRGLKQKVISTEMVIKQIQENIVMHQLKLSSHLIHFLQSLDLKQLEQDHFSPNDIPVKFLKQKDFVGIFAEKQNLRRAEDKMNEILKEEVIKLSPEQTGENWTRFFMKLQDEVDSSRNAQNLRMTQSDTQVAIYGFCSVVADVARKVRGYLENKEPTTVNVNLKSVREVEFVASCVKLSELPEIKRLGATILACRATTFPCLKVTAAKDDVQEAVGVIEKQVSSIVVERLRYCKAGEAKVLDKYEANVKAKAKEIQCNLYLSQEQASKPDAPKSFAYKIGRFITLAVTQGTLQHLGDADALVCPMNGNLAFDNPVAQQFLSLGGDQISEVCKKHQKERQSLLPGDVAVSDVGKLNAKTLIYAVIPQKGQNLDLHYLQSALHNSLLKAEDQHCASILIPAPACETFGFSVKEACTALREAILQFCSDHQNSPKNLRYICLMHHDGKAVQEYNALMKDIGVPSTYNHGSDKQVLINNVPIYLKNSDITKETVDVIVNSNSVNLNLDTGVSGAILKAAGKSVLNECAKQAPLKPGGVLMTSGGALKCKYIAQMVGPSKPADITSSLGKVLSLCEGKKATTLAIPAIGTGYGGIKPKESIEAILSAIKKHLTGLNSSYLKEITIVTFDQKIYDAYRPCIKDWNKPFTHGRPPLCKMPENQVKIGGVRIELKKGDITRETVRGIVNTTNREMSLRGGVSGAIFKAAGTTVEQECETHGPLQNDIPAVTSGGNLQCDVIIHMIGPQSAAETRSRVRKVLERCEERQITTVSFPAVGTGGGGVRCTAAICAMLKGFEDHLAQNSSTVLKLIYIVIDRDDVLQEFQQGLKAWTANTQDSEEDDDYEDYGEDYDDDEQEESDCSADDECTSSDPESDSDTTNPGEATIGPMKVKVICGDITKETTDAIVNSTTTNLDLTTGVSGAILKAAGQTVVKECKTKAPQPTDGVVLTKAGNLKNIRNIVHMVGQNNVKDTTSSVFKVLKKCEDNNVRSVSFPALGTGAGHLAPAQVANAMMEAVANFVKGSPTHLKCIHIVIFQSKMLPDFQEALKNLKKISGDAHKAPKSPQTPVYIRRPLLPHLCLAKETASVSFPVMDLEIYGMSSTNIAKVKKYLDDLIAEECVSNDVQSSHLDNLPETDKKAIVTLSQSNQVSILLAGPDKWTVSGKKDDVFDAVLKITNIIQRAHDREIREGEVKRLSQTLCWEVFEGETWEPLEASISYEVELSFHNKQKTFQYQENGQTYTVNFRDMMVRNESKKKSCRIRRTLLGDSNTAIIHPPPTWTKMDGQDLEIITLKSYSEEYDKIETDFLRSSIHQDVSRVQVEQIDRIQSQSQWHRYCVLKQAVDKKYPKQTNERFLYHGTTKEICQKINKNGFNRSFCGRNAVAHGEGTYFAKNAWYSCQDQYSNPDDEGLKYVYRARVVTGSLCKSRHGMKEPDPIKPQDPQAGLHDCAVDNLRNPSIFVVFCDAGAYPEYLITFSTI